MVTDKSTIDDGGFFITRAPYLVGVVFLATCLMFEIRALQESDVVFLLWLGLTPVVFLLLLAGVALASGLPGGAMLPKPFIQLWFFSFVVGLSSVIFYASLAAAEWVISPFILLLGALVLMASTTLLLGNFPVLLDHPIKRWMSERWGLTGIVLVALTILEATVLGRAYGHGYNAVMFVLAVATLLKLATCAFAPRSIPQELAAA